MKPFSKIVLLSAFIELLIGTNVFAAKKDFKGLFGSYRRERFTENEAGSGEIGVDIMLSTLLPMTPLIQSQEAVNGPKSSLNYATFFNVEGGLNYSLTYNWLIYATVGYFNYDTRKQTASSSAQKPTFHQFDMTAVPLILGVKYRLNTSDIVPYVGLGAGISLINQKGFYDSSTQNKVRSMSSVTGEVIAGVEFYFAPKAGIRMELAGYFMKIDPDTFNSGAPPGDLPILHFQGNVWSVRYASGVFFLF